MLVIFDCDGVLIDSEVIFCAVDSEALARLGHVMTPSEFARRFCGTPHHVAWSTLSAELGFAIPDQLIEEVRAECARRFEIELQAIPGAAEAIAAAAGFGHPPCVASSTSLPNLRRNLGWAGLLPRVDPHVFSASQVARGKPAPDVFLYAASQMGADPADCLVIEDSVFGVTAARRAGMRVVGFIGGGHADADLPLRLQAAGAGRIFSTMAEIAAWLEAGAPAPGYAARPAPSAAAPRPRRPAPRR
ncbi:beta-phosphoglucomutase-like phosphatase (HAD superfamily) [Inquilinus ginsengisoli]|uniref:Beta-phosphoglucomutase-like phosphatase (HAD superfamily) n=1 Tax=Inquilinus ginsengisoli TaxID=363840 RepID=A0ABU1JJT7_9PROT|nr:HAD-IA family hydrolase [Inquilinus ginsengisoli]MDR6288284.1 beta-phosphoglucomutase-like phosphatase (HAD superfamily) [Inquilinus ginsengisoli]